MTNYNNNIKQKVNQYFMERLGLREYKNGWIKGDCPYCGKFKFGIRISSWQANCFSCGNKYNPIRVIMEVENFKTKPELYAFLKGFEGVQFLEPAPEIRDVIKVRLPESFRLLSLGDSEMGNMARRYMKKRGFNINSLSARGIGYCTEGEYEGFIIFPFYQQGKIIYFIGRRFIQIGEKFKNPAVADFGIGKSMLVYNIDALGIFNHVCLVESIVNCLTWGDNAIATLGKKVSSYQVSTILKSPIKSITIGLDGDAYGEGIRLALQLVHYKKVRVMKLGEEDINDLGRKESKKIARETPWQSYNDLLKLKHKYEERASNSY